MGYGDEIMATAHVRKLFSEHSRKTMILDRLGRPRWNDIWENNPLIARPGEKGSFSLHLNGGGVRPYIQSADRTRYHFIPGTLPGPGEIYFSDWEKSLISRRKARWSDFVVIEPHTKATASKNKNWGWGNYIDLVSELRGVRLIQLGPVGTLRLPGVELIETSSFREAIGVLSIAKGYVGNEGGFHHAAAALGIPAVVIFGGFISPEVTGYSKPNGAEHRNLFVRTEEHPYGCGWRSIICAHCQQAMSKIVPSSVANEVRDVTAAIAAFA